ncbi:MAG: hypothetical protein RL660_455 [Bacteroidota bacterium]|jgi:predicted DNA-binding protein YlxM (UPF0122 family)
MARNSTLLAKRNAAIYDAYKALADKNKQERKYRLDYMIAQIADKFFVTPGTVYNAIRTHVQPQQPLPPPSLFDQEGATV